VKKTTLVGGLLDVTAIFSKALKRRTLDKKRKKRTFCWRDQMDKIHTTRVRFWRW